MTTDYTALLHLPGNPAFNLYGYTPLQRSLLALQKSGVNEAWLLTDQPEASLAVELKPVKTSASIFSKNHKRKLPSTLPLHRPPKPSSSSRNPSPQIYPSCRI